MVQLIVTSPFPPYQVGDEITDPQTIAAILAGPDRGNVVEINVGGAGGGAETLTVGVANAVAFQPLALAGEVSGGTPAALDCTVNAGATWSPVGAFILAGDSWTGTGPILPAGQRGSVIVRDHANSSVVSPPATFIVGGAGGGAATGTLTLSDGSVFDALGAGLAISQTGAAGPLSVAFGTQAGMVADGGALSAEAASRQAGEAAAAAALAGVQQAAAAALAAETTARQAADTAAAQALATETTARQAGDAASAQALATETAARQAGDAAGAQALTGVQAVAAAALPAAKLGAAGGAAPLDAHALLPAANIPSIAALGWADTPGTAAIFHRGPVPTPLPTRTGMLLADRFKLAGEYDFGEVWDTQQTFDAWPALQNFLLYCQSMALAMKNSGIDNLTQRSAVRAILPRGAYLISQPLIVPEYVDLDCRGTLYRAAYTGNQSNDGITSFPGPFATNSFLPMVVVAPRAHATALNLYVNTDGMLAHRGSGVAIGKTWAAQVGQPCTIGNAGAAYSVGDLLFMAQPSVGPYFNWAAQVTAISGGGATGPIASATVYAAGAYALPPTTYNNGPSLQQQQWTTANGFAGVLDPANPGCFQVHAAYHNDAKTPSPGTGATLAPTWQADYVPGTAAYNIGSAITNGSQIGKIQITGGIPVAIDAVHGPTFGVMVTGLETVIEEIQLLGGNAGVYGYFANDVRIGILNVVEAGVGVELFGCGSWHCPTVVLDTCGAAFLINETQGVRMGFRAFFEQNNITLPNAFPNSLGNAIQIGTASSAQFPNADIHLDGTLVNMGGLPQSTIAKYPGTAIGGQTPRPMAASISLAWLFSSGIRVKVTNIGEQGGVPTLLPTAGFCVFGQGVDAGNVIEGAIDTVPTIDGNPAPAQLVTLTAGHAFPSCAMRVWDGLHQCWLGPFNTVEMFGATAPVNGASGTANGLATPGSTYVDTAGGAGRRYVNTGTQAAPVWS